MTGQDEEGPRQVNGLHRISEAALNRLDDRAFGAVRQGGALAVAYAQLLSMGNSVDLGKLAQARAARGAGSGGPAGERGTSVNSAQRRRN
ncbi:hypothetical protein DK427_08480 [Methylobacterium radiodurans]|uniref:Uncharacterized protein n=1 Tax=Methylobacterium radiodurans TaxID=2202828 RepID=A0A2U8VQN1_9HYPH|nr:hypothetical protein DK427_08480 [Methylobacterium radiodurans]